MRYKIIQGDAQKIIPTLGLESFEACLCDPPYHLTSKSDTKHGFMGNIWDGGNIAFQKETWEAVKNSLVNGAFLMAFGGTRTFHRLVCGIEDSGMTIRDTIAWIYADSRPPSIDVSKSIDKAKGLQRKVVGKYRPPEMDSDWNLQNATDKRTVNSFSSSRNNLDITAPESLEACLFDGYGTALKPACELVSLSMKPMVGNFVDNALNIGVSGMNINPARLPVENGVCLSGGSGRLLSHIRDGKCENENGNGYIPSSLGRWPKNVLLDQEASILLNEQFQGANRFFYCNKVSTKERNEGLPNAIYNTHPTLKPIMLTKYLASLLLPPAQKGRIRRILVPFSGTGSEMIGAMLAGWDEVIGIENGGGDLKVSDYHCQVANLRLKYWCEKCESEKDGLFD